MAKNEIPVPYPVQNKQATIWRYMDFTKFVSLLDKCSLFFCRSDNKLLNDPFEGSSTLPNVNMLKRSFYSEQILGGKIGVAKMDEILQHISQSKKDFRQYVYINSWCMKKNTSVAMWKLYTHSNEAVVIKSTYQHLQESLPDKMVFIGRVHYIDYKKGGFTERYVTDRFFYKQKSYDYEKELRAIFLALKPEWLPDMGAIQTNGGIYVKTRINVLIDEIYIAPNSSDWFLELVQSVTKKYGIIKIPKRTELEDEAIF